MTNMNRVKPGIPTGGQFATTARAGADMSDMDLGLEEAPSVVTKESIYTRKYDSQEEKLAAIHRELEDMVGALSDDEQWNDYLDTMSKFHRYSAYNQLLIAVQTKGEATQVAGFNKWKEMERSVKKGEKAITILAPKRVTVTEKDANGKPVLGADGKPNKQSKIVGFTTASVFDVSQTEGKDLPDGGDGVLSETPPEGFKEDLEAAIAESGYKLTYEDISGGARGYTSPEGKVVVQQGMTPADTARTLAHELGHIRAGHMDRLAEYHEGHNGNRGAMEVEAESIAYVTLRANGMSPEVGGKSSRYVAGWGGTDGEQVRKSAEHVQKTVKGLLGSGRFRNAEAMA